MIVTQSGEPKKNLDLVNLSEAISQDRIEFYKCFLHDFSSQTRTIKSFTGIIKDSMDFKDQDLELLNFIDKAGDRLRQLMDVFNRMLELEKYTVQLEEMSVQSSLHNINVFVKAHTEKKDVVLLTPELDSKTLFLADRYLLEECYKEIIGNAVKFNTTSKTEIKVLSEINDDLFIIHILDNGSKLNPEMSLEAVHYLSKLTLWEDTYGNGCGLSFANKMTSMMGANLHFNKYHTDKSGNCVSLEFKTLNSTSLVN